MFLHLYKHPFITLPFLLKCSLGKHFTIYSFFQIALSSGVSIKIAFYYIRNILAALEGLYFFGVIICFISFSFYSLVWFLEFWNSIYRLSNTLYLFLYFHETAFTSLHICYLRVFVLITYLQRYIFIIFHLSQISEKNHITSP